MAPGLLLKPGVYFNPRSLVGNDWMQAVESHLFDISIHVPSWGTTSTMLFMDPSELFQSTFPRGERRPVIAPSYFWYVISIHVPSWGTTALRLLFLNSTTDFNPRSLVGNDCTLLSSSAFWRISIHVPSWGTTM